MAKKNVVVEKAVTTEVVATEVEVATTEVAAAVEQTAAAVAEVEVVTPVVVKKSDIIRSMYQEGISVSEIAKQTSSHYSFVYGVVKNMLGGEKPTSEKGPSRSDDIRKMADEGKTPGEIAKALNANYSFVHTVVKKYKADQAKAAVKEVQA